MNEIFPIHMIFYLKHCESDKKQKFLLHLKYSFRSFVNLIKG